MQEKIEAVLFDLWMTLVFGLSTDPILTLQRNLTGDHDAALDPRFLHACLTTNIGRPGRFLDRIGRTSGYTVTPETRESFRALIKAERSAVTLYPETLAVLSELKRRGYRLGVISNLWPFPVKHIFERMGLGAHFEHLIYSFAEGHRKPSAEIFASASRSFGVAPANCLMVGDSIESDIKGALAYGMNAALVNRTGKALVPPADSFSITSLSGLITRLDEGGGLCSR